MRISGRVAVVTGASEGIGRALARRLAAGGARVVLVARSAAALDALASDLEESGPAFGLGPAGTGRLPLEDGRPAAIACPGDVADPATAERAVEAALQRFGRLDILVNNAGVGLRAPVASLDYEELIRVFLVNVAGPLHFIRQAVPHIARQDEGYVVNVSSISARQPVPLLGGYSATKNALAALGDALRLELSGTGVKVLTAFPGSVETDFKSHARGLPYPERKGARRLSPEAVAERVVTAVEAGRREVFILSRSERAGLALGRVLPGVVEKSLLRRYGGS